MGDLLEDNEQDEDDFSWLASGTWFSYRAGLPKHWELFGSERRDWTRPNRAGSAPGVTQVTIGVHACTEPHRLLATLAQLRAATHHPYDLLVLTPAGVGRKYSARPFPWRSPS